MFDLYRHSVLRRLCCRGEVFVSVFFQTCCLVYRMIMTFSTAGIHKVPEQNSKYLPAPFYFHKSHVLAQKKSVLALVNVIERLMADVYHMRRLLRLPSDKINICSVLHIHYNESQ